MVSYYTAKFVDHRNCGSEEKTFLICHEIVQDQIT